MWALDKKNDNCVGLKLAKTLALPCFVLGAKIKRGNATQANQVLHLDLTSYVMFFNANTCVHLLFL